MTPIAMASNQESVVRTICCYCGTGCGVKLTVKDGEVTHIEGDERHPANFGRLCSKGRTLHHTVNKPTARVLSAKIRENKTAAYTKSSTEAAWDETADRLANIIQKHGPESVAFYLSGQLLTEDYAVFNKLARGLIGTNHIDTNSRLCMSSAVMGYKLTLGADAPPCNYEDIELADCVLIAGSNMAYAHPVLFRRLEQAKADRPEMKIIVVDPRQTDTTQLADLHLAIKPGTDIALFHAMLNVMVWNGWVDTDYIEQHTEGFENLKRRLHEYTPRSVAALCGISEDSIHQAAKWFGASDKSLSLYTMGLNQSSTGTHNNAAIIHLHLATGKIGRMGCGPFSLTGQPNAMGGREAGGMATLLPGHRSPTNPQHREAVAKLWQVPSLPSHEGLTAIDLFDALESGTIKAVWIAATNPAVSLPNQHKIDAALKKAELVIVQEAFKQCETLQYADIVLPAATWPEKDGTLTNSERCISRVRAAILPPDNVYPDWRHVVEIAKRLATRLNPALLPAFSYAGVSEIFTEHALTTQGQDLDYSELNYPKMEAWGPIQWPIRQGKGSDRLYADGQFPTASGKAQFLDFDYAPMYESPSAPYPVSLTTGRVRDQWHTTHRTSLSSTLIQHISEPYISLSARDMQRYKLEEGDLCQIKSKRGLVFLPAKVDKGLKPNYAFLPMHWGRGVMSQGGVNSLLHQGKDGISKQPDLKHAAVALSKANLPWQLIAWVQGDTNDWQDRLKPWLEEFPYVTLLPSSLAGVGVMLKLASTQAPHKEVAQALFSDLALLNAPVQFDDAAQNVWRRVGLNSNREPIAWVLAGDIRAKDALIEWTEQRQTSKTLLQLFNPSQTSKADDKVICACEGVKQSSIQKAIQSGASLVDMQKTLKCGTGCGSCVPEIKRMIQIAGI